MASPPDRIRVGKTNAAVLAGVDDLREWDDEELEYGKRRDKNGKFGGSLPKVVPYAMHQELNRRRMTNAYQKLTQHVMDAATYIADVAAGTVEADRHRLHACEMLLNRVLGKEPQKVELAVDRRPYQATLDRVVTRRTMPEGRTPRALPPGQPTDVDRYTRSAAVVDVQARETVAPPATGPASPAPAQAPVQPGANRTTNRMPRPRRIGRVRRGD